VSDALYFHGGGEFFTIWSPEVLFEMDSGWDSAKATCRAAGRSSPEGKRK
jgi:MraZ protein